MSSDEKAKDEPNTDPLPIFPLKQKRSKSVNKSKSLQQNKDLHKNHTSDESNNSVFHNIFNSSTSKVKKLSDYSNSNISFSGQSGDISYNQSSSNVNEDEYPNYDNGFRYFDQPEFKNQEFDQQENNMQDNPQFENSQPEANNIQQFDQQENIQENHMQDNLQLENSQPEASSIQDSNQQNSSLDDYDIFFGVIDNVEKKNFHKPKNQIKNSENNNESSEPKKYRQKLNTYGLKREFVFKFYEMMHRLLPNLSLNGIDAELKKLAPTLLKK